MLRHGSRWAGSVAALLTAGLFACGAENETELVCYSPYQLTDGEAITGV